MKKKINDKFFNYDRLFSIIMVLLPFLYQYKGLGNIISFGELLFFPFILIYILFLKENKYKVRITREILFYFIIILLSLIVSVSNYFSYSDFVTILARIIFYFIICQIAKDHFKINYVLKFYDKVVFAFSIYLIIQYVVYKCTGNYLPRYISSNLLFPPEKNARILTDYYKWIFRPSSLFLEPGYFTLFCIPYVCLLFFKKKNNLIIKIEHVIVLIALFLSGSSAALVSIAIIIYLYFNYFFKNHGFKKGINIIITTLLSIIILLFVITNFKNNDIVERTISGASFNNRVTRGIIVYDKMSSINKLMGVGINNLGNYMEYNGISTEFDETNLNYCSSIVQILTNSGIIGFIFFVIYLAGIFKISKNNICSKILFVMLLFLLSYENILFSYRFCFIYAFICGLKDYKQIEISKN